MRGFAALLIAPALACCAWAIVAALRMGAWLTRHGVKINWIWFRLTMPWYVHRYRTMTTELEGRPGSLFPQFVVAINAALVLTIVMLVLVAIGKR